ncbi:hypothetical protein NKR23_g588 [Pleurostoma richardsiae]|uniref:Uncharacterized protein n=1 Tax=Pleurostoma richardsiae TaxID=41990 RepID=A0AA38W0Z6_9PEZI|nr:hypothetical protein NKR23_g588 [Pleurostoma richardsiae]
MSGFPKLIPAFTAQLFISPPNQVGTLATGTSLTHVTILPDQGFLRSEPGYPIQLDATVLHGSDYIKGDADGAHVRLEVASLLKDKKTGGLLRFCYTGTIEMGGEAGKVLTGHADAKTTPFGECFTQVSFETGTPELKALGCKVFVGAGRFVLEEGKPVAVEYKISQVAH